MGILDTLFGSPDEDIAAREALKKSEKAYEQIEAPMLSNVFLDQYQDTYKPTFAENYELGSPDAIAAEQAAAAQMGGTAFENVNSDPRLKQAQMDALMSLQELGANGGLSASDKALLSKQRADVAMQERGSREAIMQDMASRGMGGSNMELLAKLQASQAGTDRLAQEGLDVTGMAQNRALQALAQSGTVAGSIRDQDFGEQSSVASAKDAIGQFNAANTQQANLANMAARNDTSQFNSAQKFDVAKTNNQNLNNTTQFNTGLSNQAALNSQDITNKNVDQKNKQTMLNSVELPQQNFNNQMAKAGGTSSASGQAVDYWTSAGNRTAATKAGIADGAVKLGAAGIAASDKNVKKEIKEISNDEIEEFLNALKPKKYKYKNPNTTKTAPGERVGFIAQDVANTDLGKDVVSKGEDGTLEFDPMNLQGVMLAALKKLSEDKE